MKKYVKLVINKNENLVLGDTEHRIYRNALDLQNAIKFHGARRRIIILLHNKCKTFLKQFFFLNSWKINAIMSRSVLTNFIQIGQ